MPKYIATVRHHSIARHYQIEIDGTLAHAKRRASQEFGDGFVDHEIVIYQPCPGYAHDVVATRRIGGRKWQDRM